MSQTALPTFHAVAIEGDHGSQDYNTACPWLWQALSTINTCNAVQATLGNLVEHAVSQQHEHVRQGKDKRQWLQEDAVLSLHPLARHARACLGNAHCSNALESDTSLRQAALRNEGVILPATAHHVKLFESLEMLTYRNFYNAYEFLSSGISRGEVYSACEGRWNVLRCRYRLHRAFNADLEDHHNVVLGGGDIVHAAKMDIRRIGSCVSSKTLVEYMKSKVFATTSTRSDQQTPREGQAAQVLKDAVEQYFGSNRPEVERILTAEGLSLRPHFAQSTEKRLDVFEKNNPMRPRGDHALNLLKHFLKFQYGDEGRQFAEIVLPALASASTLRPREFVELELTVHGLRSGEILFLADWCSRFDLYRFEPRIRVTLRLVLMEIPHAEQDAEAAMKYKGCLSFADVLSFIFEPLWQGLREPKTYPLLAKFLSILNGISVAVDDANETQLLPLPGTKPPSEYHLRGREGLPPDSYFFFFVWRNVQLFNIGILNSLIDVAPDAGGTAEVVMDRTLQFRIHSDNKLRSFSHCVTALLIADTVVNPIRIPSWSPLGYLFYLTQRHVVVTPSVNNAMNAPFNSRKSGLVALIESGINVSIASMDPLHHHTTENAMEEELNTVQKVFHFSAADMTELCLRSVENGNFSVQEIRAVYPNSIRWTAVASGVEIDMPHGAFASSSTAATVGEGGTSAARSAASLGSADSTTAAGIGGGLYEPFSHHFKRHQQGGPAGSTSYYHHHRANHSITALYNRFPETQVPTVRLAFRELCHEHEVQLLWKCLSKQTLSVERPLSLMTTISIAAGHGYVEGHVQFPRLVVRGPQVTRPSRVAKTLVEIIGVREKYRRLSIGSPDAVASRSLGSVQDAPRGGAGGGAAPVVHTLAESSVTLQERDIQFYVRDGIVQPVSGLEIPIPTWREYMEDYRRLRRFVHDPESIIFCKRRLATLEHKFHLHRALMDSVENNVPSATASIGGAAAAVLQQQQPSASSSKQRALPHEQPQQQKQYTPSTTSAHEFSDFYRCVKVDVHCHMASGMTGRQLLEFMQLKAREAPDDIVSVDSQTGKPVTLLELLLRITRQRFGPSATVEDLTVSALDVQASSSTFNRFDHFNNKYNPLGVSELRSLFLKTDNFMGGRYFAELIKATLLRQQSTTIQRNIFSEFRLSIYGRHRDEWANLARWWSSHGMNHRSNRWMVQVPRIYDVYHSSRLVLSFEQLLENIFVPLWEVTMNRSKDPILASFLDHVSGFDSVDNESGREVDPTTVLKTPEQWTSSSNPPFSYWMYYMWANIAAINQVRLRRRCSTFAFRPHCGESGDPDHLIDAYFLADGIGHGVQLKRRSTLQYLFYLAQIGLGMTPLSNNALFCRYSDNPFPQLFYRGLNVTLSTDGPLQFHHTDEPLVEEYGTAMKFWDLSTVDACEIAGNSVRMCGFPVSYKQEWLGDVYMLRSTVGNDVARSRVPHSRVGYRYEVYDNECRYLEHRAALVIPYRAMLPAAMEDLVTIDAVNLTRNQVIERRMKGLPVSKKAKAGVVLVDRSKL